MNFMASVEQHTLPREIWKGVREMISPTVLAVATFMVLPLGHRADRDRDAAPAQRTIPGWESLGALRRTEEGQS